MRAQIGRLSSLASVLPPRLFCGISLIVTILILAASRVRSVWLLALML